MCACMISFIQHKVGALCIFGFQMQLWKMVGFCFVYWSLLNLGSGWNTDIKLDDASTKSSHMFINPFTYPVCKISRLKLVKDARTCLKNCIFSSPISITHLLSVLCILRKILWHAGAKKKTKRLKFFNFTLSLVVFREHHGSERVNKLLSETLVHTSVKLFQQDAPHRLC